MIYSFDQINTEQAINIESSSFGDELIKPRIVFKDVESISNGASTNENIHAVASGTYGSSDMLGASSVFSDDVFNSRQDAPLRVVAELIESGSHEMRKW